jgi:hypothetical protein
LKRVKYRRFVYQVNACISTKTVIADGAMVKWILP